jgi:hypothetical protein
MHHPCHVKQVKLPFLVSLCDDAEVDAAGRKLQLLLPYRPISDVVAEVRHRPPGLEGSATAVQFPTLLCAGRPAR